MSLLRPNPPTTTTARHRIADDSPIERGPRCSPGGPRTLLSAVLLGALLGFATPAWAMLEGRVVDARSGEPIAGATVLIVGQTGETRTDADGRFTWTPDPKPPFEVIVVLPGGQMARPMLIREVDWAAVLTLRVEPVLSEEVQVTVGLAPSVDATPAAGTTMLPGEEISRRVPSNLNQVLENVAGVSQVSEGQAAVPALRGFAQGRTLILIDGARVSSERRVGPSATFLDPATLEGVDVARGPGSVAYGSDAFGGVISVRTRRPAANSPFRGQLSGTLGAGVPDRRASLALSRGHPGGAVFVQGHYRDASDYDGPEGAVINSSWRDSGFLVRLIQNAGRGIFSAGLQSDFGRDIERPRDNSASVRFYYPYETSHRLTASFDNTATLGFDQLRLNAFWGTYDQRTDQDTVPTETVLRAIERADITAKDYGFRAVAEKLLAETQIELGLDVNGRYGLEAHDINIAYDAAGNVGSSHDVVSIESASKIDVGLFAQTQTSLGDRLVLAAGLRVDLVENRNSGGYFGDHSTSNTAGSGFAALTVGPFGGLSITGQYARGYRDPRLSDLYYRGPTGRGFITGNPDLDAERSEQFDLAFRFTSGPARIAAYVFQYEFTNLIERFETDDDFFFFRNRGEARVRGVEIEAQLALGAYAVEVAGQVQRGVARDAAGGHLDDQPDDSLRLIVRRALGRGSVYGRLGLYAPHDRPGPNERYAPGYTLVDFGATWRFSDRLELRGLARNLLNQAYHASPVRRWVPAPGRNASLTTVLTF